jgi:hypothetical protein
MQAGPFSANADYPLPRSSRRSAGNGAHGAGYDTESDSDKEQERGESDSRAAPADKAAAENIPADKVAAQEDQAVRGPIMSQLSSAAIVEPVPMRPTLVYPSPGGGPGIRSDSDKGGQAAVVAQAYPVTVSADAAEGHWLGQLDPGMVVRAYPLGAGPQGSVAAAAVDAAVAEQVAHGPGLAAEGVGGAGGKADMDEAMERVRQQEARLRDEYAGFLDGFRCAHTRRRDGVVGGCSTDDSS